MYSSGFKQKLWASSFSHSNEIKVKNDHRSKFSNLSNWKEEAWKNQGFNGIRTRDLRDTGTMLYQLSYEATLYQLSYEAMKPRFFFPVA